MENAQELPALVRRYLERALVSPEAVPRRVQVTQEGEMRLKPGGRALRFSAAELFAVERVEFSWQARFALAPLISLHVRDGYAAGVGSLEARLLGRLLVMRRRGPDLDVGEAMRYLAELPWAPHAMRTNRELRWRELDAQTVEVATNVGSRRAAVQFEFDATGDITASYAAARPYPRGKTSVPTPWRGLFSEYRVVGGVMLPAQAEVRWELPEGDFTYWRGTITGLELRS